MTFSKLLAGQRIVPERTFRIVLPFPQLGNGIPAIVVRHCGEENPAFYNAWKKRTRMQGALPATVERLQREIDAPILGEHGVAALEYIYDDDLALAEYTPAKATELLAAIASESPQLFDTIRGTCMVDELYRDQPPPDAVAVGKD
jgi:hypothetical protein